MGYGIDDQVLEGGRLPVENVSKEDVAKALVALKEYKAGKESLESRIVENEQWYKMRHWAYMRSKYNAGKDAAARIEPSSGWLFNSIANKHADFMDNYPEANILPREKGDTEDARQLSSIVPVILERNGFEQTYSDEQWYKLKSGTGAYGVFWDPTVDNGLGDISVKKLDILNLFWEPGITDIQKSRNLFIVDLVDTDILDDQYPEHAGKMQSKIIDVKEYVYDDKVDTTKKAAVVDWYYKRTYQGRTVLHYAKIVGDILLFASENEPEYALEGWYKHGKYPVVLDVLYPEEGTPFGFGYVDICKDSQTYVDKLNQIIMENSLISGKPRYFTKQNSGIDPKDFADWSKTVIQVAGDLHDNIRLIETKQLDSGIMNFMTYKVDELKETSGNRDVNQGGSGGVTAAAAIAAMQEAGNKLSRDILKASYRAFTDVCYIVIELIREFYDEERTFRITGPNQEIDFVDYSNANLIPQETDAVAPGAEAGYRVPIFDIKIKPQKSNPFSRMAQNELMKELYGMGFFNPQMADQALIALGGMEFEGKDELIDSISKNQTLAEIVQQLGQQLMIKDAQLYQVSGGAIGAPPDMQMMAAAQGGGQPAPARQVPASKATDGGITRAVDNATTPYGQKLAERARVSANGSGDIV